MHQRVCKGDLTKEITKIRLCIWEVKSDYKRQEEWTQSALFKSGRKYVVLHTLCCNRTFYNAKQKVKLYDRDQGKLLRRERDFSKK